MSHGRAGPTRRAALVGLGGAVMACAAPPSPSPVAADDDHAGALAAFLKSAARLAEENPAWRGVAAAAGRAEPRGFFETWLRPGAPVETFFTAYFEPVLAASRRAEGPYRWPLHAPPPDLDGAPHRTRAEIAAGALDGQGLELFWLADPVEAFFLHIQGSGRLRLPGGETVRVGYAARNNHPYRAIGAVLVARGHMTPETATAEAIKAWLRADPARGAAVMAENPSYIFFREIRGLGPDDGPIGAMGAPLTPYRSLAVDPAAHPLGAPFWVETPALGRKGRLMIAQDVGAAIRGPGRADLFFGAGAEAGAAAGAVREHGRMIPLLPRDASGA